MTIYVFGSCNVDFVTHIEKHPRPGETVLCQEHHLFSGGKGANQAVAAAKAGSQVHMVACIGEDHLGDFILNSLQKYTVGTTHIRRCATSSGCAFISIDAQGENAIIVSAGANYQMKAHHFPYQELSSKDTVLLQMEVPSDENWAVITQAKKQEARVILNLAPAGLIPRSILPMLDILIVNTHEIQALGASLSQGADSPENLACTISQAFKIDVILTLGAKGLWAVTSCGATFSIPAIPVHVIDTVGAGDCFIGYLSSGLDRGLLFQESLVQATVASGLACTRHGAQEAIPSALEVHHHIKSC